MTTAPILPGVWWVDVPEEGLRILCGTPMDSIKHLMRKGLVQKVEENGVKFETGPNAILLSDLPIQGGRLWNLAEFPVLHMMFRQGMSIPGHPGNTGRKPMILGLDERVEKVGEYIQRGNYGLINKEEMKRYGVVEEFFEDQWRLKLKFAGGQIADKESLVDFVRLSPGGGRITENLELERLDTNIYRFASSDSSVEINMNLPEEKDWYPSYELPHVQVSPSGFSVVHIGEGNGWDKDRPCMGSLINYRGRKYLIDAGPGIGYTVEHLGMDLNEIDGLFFTHAHDDHFAGLICLLRRERPITVYAAPEVMATVQKKCISLMERDMDYVNLMMKVEILDEDEWNNVDGLDVRPTTSPHPVETTILFFRAPDESGYKVYGHLADVVSRQVVEGFAGEDGVSDGFIERVFHEYGRPCDLKKIDVGRGMIHGFAEDFSDDISEKIVLSHTEGEVRKEDLVYGQAVEFGDVDILIPGSDSDETSTIPTIMELGLPFLSREQQETIIQRPVVHYPPKSNISKEIDFSENLLILTAGSVRRDTGSSLTSLRVSPGGIIGEEELLLRDDQSVYTSVGFISGIHLPSDEYQEMLRNEGLSDLRMSRLKTRLVLQNGDFPGQKVSSPRLDRLIDEIIEKDLSRGARISSGQNSPDEIYLLREGSVVNRKTGRFVTAGEWLNTERVIHPANPGPREKWKVSETTRIIVIPGEKVRKIPALNWTLRESIERP